METGISEDLAREPVVRAYEIQEGWRGDQWTDVPAACFALNETSSSSNSFWGFFFFLSIRDVSVPSVVAVILVSEGLLR